VDAGIHYDDCPFLALPGFRFTSFHLEPEKIGVLFGTIYYRSGSGSVPRPLKAVSSKFVVKCE